MLLHTSENFGFSPEEARSVEELSPVEKFKKFFETEKLQELRQALTQIVTDREKQFEACIEANEARRQAYITEIIAMLETNREIPNHNWAFPQSSYDAVTASVIELKISHSEEFRQLWQTVTVTQQVVERVKYDVDLADRFIEFLINHLEELKNYLLNQDKTNPFPDSMFFNTLLFSLKHQWHLATIFFVHQKMPATISAHSDNELKTAIERYSQEAINRFFVAFNAILPNERDQVSSQVTADMLIIDTLTRYLQACGADIFVNERTHRGKIFQQLVFSFAANETTKKNFNALAMKQFTEPFYFKWDNFSLELPITDDTQYTQKICQYVTEKGFRVTSYPRRDSMP